MCSIPRPLLIGGPYATALCHAKVKCGGIGSYEIVILHGYHVYLNLPLQLGFKQYCLAV